jgi:cellulose synthase/poly-beta-1,6-N-acetylglucosamine synthase-like glycosyltransferase
MAVSKNAYNETDGYFKYEFSVTEDLTLFKAITNKGYSAISLLSPQNLNFSKAQTNFKSFLHQRKRWLIGANGLNFKWKFILFLFSLFYPLLIFLSFYSLKNVVIIWLCKVVLQSVLVIVISNKLKNKFNFFYLFCFEFYSIVSILLISIFYLIPIKMEWKNRKF